jgi:KaiC/GvpD/RAD55 family RecA-like ATPase
MPATLEKREGLADRLYALSGANLVVTGPPMVGKSRFAADALEKAEDSLLVTTTRNAFQQLRVTDIGLTDVDIVDCTPTPIEERKGVTTVGSPADLTGMSMPVSEFLRGADSPHVAFDSVSSMLLYTDPAPVFRFLSVLTAHVRNADGLGLYTLDPGCHEDETVGTLSQVFDGRVELRERDGRREARVVGLDADLPDGWHPL